MKKKSERTIKTDGVVRQVGRRPRDPLIYETPEWELNRRLSKGRVGLTVVVICSKDH